MKLDISWTFLCPRPVTPSASDTSILPDRHDDETYFCDDEDNHEYDGDFVPHHGLTHVMT